MADDEEMARRKEALGPRGLELASSLTEYEVRGTQALIVIRSRASRDAAEALLDLGEDLHHLVWAQSLGIEAIVKLYLDESHEDVTIVTGKAGKQKLAAVTSLSADEEVESLITSAGAAAYSRLLGKMRSLETVKAERAREARKARIEAEGKDSERAPVVLDRPRAGLYAGGAFKAVFTDSLRSTLRVV